MQIAKLSDAEINSLETMRYNNIKKFYKYSVLIVIGFILFSLITVSFLPKSGRMDDSFDKSQNLIQSMGLSFWAMVVIPLASIIILALFADLKIISLKKDIESGEKINDLFRIEEIVSESSRSIFALILESKSIKKLVINIKQQEVPLYSVGQEFNLWILRHSKIVMK